MAINVGAGGRLSLVAGTTEGRAAIGGGLGATYNPATPAFWSLVILALLIVAIVVIARGIA
jgi:hypothetical protein